MSTGQIGEYPIGCLVRIRERDWVVLPSDDADILCLRPLSGSESEICGIHRAIEGRHLPLPAIRSGVRAGDERQTRRGDFAYD